MKLILAEYINSLKEDGELDILIQDILRANNIEIFSKPERGRQYGVDIYAVGRDFNDANKRKVFLITVKQGDLDRNTWDTDKNSVRQSLDEIRTVFVKNNLASQHKKLPIKIIVAYNGLLKQGVQQNWRGYTDQYPDFEYELWEMDFLVNEFENKLLNESGFSNELRSFIRKTIIHLENPDYNLSDFVQILDIMIVDFQKARSKKAKFKSLKQLHLIVAIIIKYCQEGDNLKHAVRCCEKYILKLWKELRNYNTDHGYVGQLILAYRFQLDVLTSYHQKLSFVTGIKDGFSRSSSNALTYTFVLYEQAGILSIYGLELVQMFEVLASSKSEKSKLVAETYRDHALEVSNAVISLINNNSIIFNPRADDQHIEIHLILMLLYKLDRHEDIKALLSEFCNQMAQGVLFSNIFPVFSNDLKKIAELEVDAKVRAEYKYSSSNLLTFLIEWTVVMNSPELYRLYRKMKENLLPELDLLLWFPDKETEDLLFDRAATNESGYALSNISLPDNFEEFRTITEVDFKNNCYEKEFSFIKETFWTIGLIASRHHRTYIFPYYWRQFLGADITENAVES